MGEMEVKSLPQESEMHSREMKRILATDGTTIPYLKQRECVCVCVICICIPLSTTP